MSIIKIIPFMIAIFLSCILIIFSKDTISIKMSIFKEIEINFSIINREKRLIFCTIIRVVTSAVLCYRTFYIEFYNKKKFNILTILFFMSIAILSIRNDFLTTIAGWDGLGISSICLIIIYQRNRTIINRLITITFNRLGDIFIIYGIILNSIELNNIRFTVNIKIGTLSSVILVLARITKRAQFPLSTWLPAAISAPTPISAIVHSSTLVTAGVYLLSKIQEPLNKNNVIMSVRVISRISMLTAGVSTLYNKDLKKTIAYSTMRHIRIMVFIIRKNINKIAMIHIFSHAIFKTAIFIRAGVIFISSISNQDTNFSRISKKINFQRIFIKSRIISLTGAPLTSSFYSKDLFVEEMIIENYKKRFLIIIIFSTILTMLYSFKIISRSTEKSNLIKNNNMKKNPIITSSIMSVIRVLGSTLSSIMLPIKSFSFIRKIEILMIPTFIILSIFLKEPKSKKLMLISTSIIFKKIITTIEINNILNWTKNTTNTDTFITSKITWKPLNIKFGKNNEFNMYYLFMAILFLSILLLTQ